MHTEVIVAIVAGFIGIIVVSICSINYHKERYDKILKENERLKRRLNNSNAAGFLTDTQSMFATGDCWVGIDVAGHSFNNTGNTRHG